MSWARAPQPSTRCSSAAGELQARVRGGGAVSSVDPVIHLLADLDHPARPRVEFRDALLALLLAELEEAMGREPEAQASARSNGWRAACWAP